MRSMLLAAIGVLGSGAAPAPKLLTPTDIVASAPASAWTAIPARDLLVMDLKNGKRVVIQLAPDFAAVHVANIRALANAGYWAGATIYRVQDNYVTQWGNNDSGKPWPKGVVAKPPAGMGERAWWFLQLVAHCYGAVGVGRGLDPDTGTGGELYAVNGQATRHMDRNLAIVGRVIEGMDQLSALPRGTEALGFYKDPAAGVPIATVRLASGIAAAGRPAFEVMDTASPSFAKYLRVRANRNDDFYRHPAGGVDLCGVQVPVRRKG